MFHGLGTYRFSICTKWMNEGENIRSALDAQRLWNKKDHGDSTPFRKTKSTPESRSICIPRQYSCKSNSIGGYSSAYTVECETSYRDNIPLMCLCLPRTIAKYSYFKLGIITALWNKGRKLPRHMKYDSSFNTGIAIFGYAVLYVNCYSLFIQ